MADVATMQDRMTAATAHHRVATLRLCRRVMHTTDTVLLRAVCRPLRFGTPTTDMDEARPRLCPRETTLLVTATTCPLRRALSTTRRRVTTLRVALRLTTHRRVVATATFHLRLVRATTTFPLPLVAVVAPPEGTLTSLRADTTMFRLEGTSFPVQ